LHGNSLKRKYTLNIFTPQHTYQWRSEEDDEEDHFPVRLNIRTKKTDSSAPSPRINGTNEPVKDELQKIEESV
jgi:hypothetical protein